jgi:ribosomal protein S18 acetylase RimI-like enzyme
VNVRRATEQDLPALHELYVGFLQEVPDPPHVEVDVERELAEVAEIVRREVAVVAERDGGVIGFALLRRSSRPGLVRLTDLYVVPDARRQGVAAALLREGVGAFREDGLEYVELEVFTTNTAARAAYARWGFRETWLHLVAPAAELEARLAGEAGAVARSFGSIHAQSDDVPAVQRAVRQFVPRLPGRSRGSIVVGPRNGWIAVYDDVCDRDPRQLRRLARELSERMGSVVIALGVEEDAVARFVLHDRGGVVDEYLSVQEYYGPLPPGDVIALQANPRVVGRLTGADPAAVRAAAVHARSPAELPPPAQTLVSLAQAMGIAGAEHGWADAPELPDALVIER